MRQPRAMVLITLAAAVASLVGSVRADEAAITRDIAAFFADTDVAQRRELAARIQADPAYDRARVPSWLHAAGLFRPLLPGRQSVRVELGGGTNREITLRLPRDYDASKPWPLIYALHGAGGNGDEIIRYVERVLAGQTEEFVVAAPSQYGEIVIHDTVWPPVGEHRAALHTIRQKVHVDSNRVYLMGYSRGGHGTWTVAVQYGDQFAAAMPLAGTFNLVGVDCLWDTFLPNVASLPMLCVWGTDDIYDDAHQPSPHGGIAGLNRKLRDHARTLGLPLTAIEQRGVGHSNVVPPPDELRRFLSHSRVQHPASVSHTFRHQQQGSAYWIEPHRWTGGQWDDQPIRISHRDGEDALNPDDRCKPIVRAYGAGLATLQGQIDGQSIRVKRKKIDELTVWIGDGMIDWDKPVTLFVSGRRVFEGAVTPDLYVCLSQAARTWDFDRLRWAGLRFRSRTRTRLVDADTDFP